MGEVVGTLSLESTSAKIERLNFQNDLLQFENYKKSLLPSFSFSVNPINFNRSIRVLQQPSDGSYSYVEDYSNNSNWGITVNQKIGWTGGELNVGSRLNYLSEFSQKRNSFNTSPFTIGYSQQLLGGRKTYKMERSLQYAKNKVSIKKYCSKLSDIQQESLKLFMVALLSKLESELECRNKEINDTLLYISKTKLTNGNITEFDFKQIELQFLNTQYAYENAMKSYEEALQRLQTYLAIEIDIQILVPVFDLPLSLDMHTVAAYVKQNNPFSVEQYIAKLEAEEALHSAKLSNRFNGTVSLNYGINQYAESFVEAYRHGNTQQSVVVGFQIPIFQWGINKNKIRIARNNFQVSQLNMENSQREFDNTVREKVNNYNRSIRLWLVAEKTYEISRQQYRMLAQKFALGKVSVYELTTARKDQDMAMQQYYAAIRDAYAEYFSLRHLALFDFKSEKELESIFIQN